MSGAHLPRLTRLLAYYNGVPVVERELGVRGNGKRGSCGSVLLGFQGSKHVLSGC